MCGRFASARKRQELLAEFRIERDRVDEPPPPDYNVAPTKPVYAVLARGGREDGGGEGPAAGEVARELRVVRWGLVPSWARDVSIGSRLINARAETLDSRPAFRRAFARRRCLLPADGFYEWHPVSQAGRVRKQPYYIHRADGGVLALAGLYEIWRDVSVPPDHPRAWLWSATIITTKAEDEVGRIHDRMPMVIAPERWADWLDPGISAASELRPLLVPAVAGTLVSHPVSTEVNSVRNNGPALIRPIPGVPGEAGVPDEAGGPGEAGGPVGTGRPGGTGDDEAASGPGRSGPGRGEAGRGGRAGAAAATPSPPAPSMTAPGHAAAAREPGRGHPIGDPLTLF